MKFEAALTIILSPDIEGGYVNDPRDPGGETKFGISKRAFPYLDIKNLTQEQVAPIYRANYWDLVRADELPDYLRLIVFDSAINQGVTAAGGMLQAVLGLPVDGIIGPKTIERVHTVDKLRMLEKYTQARVTRYVENRKLPIYCKGWWKRMNIIVFRSFEILRG